MSDAAKSAVAAAVGEEWLRRALRLPEGHRPFPWQLQLLQRFMQGEATDAIDIPTGLGKTAVMAVWLVARACGASIPRRLVYVVDRRAVVDQATEVAEALRAWVREEEAVADALRLEARPLAISTLRGAHVDNKAWLEDPGAEAIVVGTIDMIGSRLLFSGYGVSPKMRSYHAGLLGADSLIVLDEAHLAPAFEDLLTEIANGQNVVGASDRAYAPHIPRFALLSLSATGRVRKNKALTLGAADLENPIVRERLDAPKTLSTLLLGAADKLPQKLAEKAWEQSSAGSAPLRCLVFCNSRNDATRVVDELKGLAARSGAPSPTIELFVGARRVRERALARDALAALGFLAGSTVSLERAVFLVATSAGEVGVDLDADHMVCDLVAWERMVQRFGRVNRRGKGRAEIVVILAPEPKRSESVEKALAKRDAAQTAEASGRAKDAAAERARQKRIRAYKDKDAKLVHEYERELDHQRALRELLQTIGERGDVSPGALVQLHQRSELRALFASSTTPEPLRPALTRALVDAWSMTSLDAHPGRPEVDPWLRGWRTSDPPQTSIVWRLHLPVRPHKSFDARGAMSFFDAAPLHASELLETEAAVAAAWLIACAERICRSGESESIFSSLAAASAVAVVLTGRGDLKAAWDLKALYATTGSQVKDQIEAVLAGATLIVDARLGGLSLGLLDQTSHAVADAADDVSAWMMRDASGVNVPLTGFRVVRVGAGGVDEQTRIGLADAWVRRAVFVLDSDDDGPTSVLAVDGWAGESALEDDRAAANVPQSLDEHQAWVEACADRIAKRVGLSGEWAESLRIAARLHDEGKRPARWQRAFNAPNDGIVYAKTRGPIDFALLDGYRHELGSLPYAQSNARLRALSLEAQELVLHLIAAHHGFARPVICTSGCDDAPPSLIDARAAQVTLRFMRLQQRWGPWGLAWWESLVRAADQEASRRNQQRRVAAELNKENYSWR